MPITNEELAARIKIVEENQKRYVLREVFDIFKEDLAITKRIVDDNKATRMKLIGAFIAFELFASPLIFILVKSWM